MKNGRVIVLIVVQVSIDLCDMNLPVAMDSTGVQGPYPHKSLNCPESIRPRIHLYDVGSDLVLPGSIHTLQSIRIKLSNMKT